MALSTLGLVRCYVSPRLGAHAQHSVRAAHQRLNRRSRSSGDRSSNDVVAAKTAGGVGAVEQDNHEDEWDTWEFGTWKVCVVSLPQLPGKRYCMMMTLRVKACGDRGARPMISFCLSMHPASLQENNNAHAAKLISAL